MGSPDCPIYLAIHVRIEMPAGSLRDRRKDCPQQVSDTDTPGQQDIIPISQRMTIAICVSGGFLLILQFFASLQNSLMRNDIT
jgi:hypothetical protein